MLSQPLEGVLIFTFHTIRILNLLTCSQLTACFMVWNYCQCFLLPAGQWYSRQTWQNSVVQYQINHNTSTLSNIDPPADRFRNWWTNWLWLPPTVSLPTPISRDVTLNSKWQFATVRVICRLMHAKFGHLRCYCGSFRCKAGVQPSQVADCLVLLNVLFGDVRRVFWRSLKAHTCFVQNHISGNVVSCHSAVVAESLIHYPSKTVCFQIHHRSLPNAIHTITKASTESSWIAETNKAIQNWWIR